MGVILRCKLAMHNGKMLKLPCVSLFQFFHLCFCKILFELIYSWKNYHKIKRVNFLLRHSVEVGLHRGITVTVTKHLYCPSYNMMGAFYGQCPQL